MDSPVEWKVVKEPTAEQILERGRTRRIKEIEYCGGVVFAYGMTRLEAKAYRQACADAAGSVEKDEYADERMVMLMIRDSAGKPIFDETHLTRLADMNEADFRPLAAACAEVNGWGPQAREDLVKNSEPTRTSVSGSDSPVGSDSPIPTK
jgi:hypothetical protein